jgi:hypothetical protein
VNDSDPRVTGERLRSWLNGRQPDREGLCLALLPHLGPFSQCSPRRPAGGPDGGRDIEAYYSDSNGGFPVWAAVGFVNDASRSARDRTAAKKKFRSDLDTALKEKPDLKGFAYLTNVDLTPGDCQDLEQSGKKRGLDVVRVFDFEQLRAALDGPAGLLARLQYLDIPMSKTEQLVLLRTHGDELQDALSSHVRGLSARLDLIEYRVGCALPLAYVATSLILQSRSTCADLVGEAALVLFARGIDATDSVGFLTEVEAPHPGERALRTNCFIWTSDNPTALPRCGGIYTPGGGWHFGGEFQVVMRRVGQRVTLGELLDYGAIRFHFTGKLGALARSFAVKANNYEVYAGAIGEVRRQGAHNFGWPPGTPAALGEREWWVDADSMWGHRTFLDLEPPRAR